MEEHEEQLRRYFEDSRLAERRVREDQLEQVMKQGLRQAAERKRDRRFAYILKWGGAAIAICLAILASLYYMPQGQPAKPASSDAVAALPAYVQKLVNKDDTLLQAVQHGLYQSLNQTLESGPYVMQIDGAIADSQRVIVFYNLTSSSSPDKKVVLENNKMQLFNRDGKPTSAIYLPYMIEGQTVTEDNQIAFDFPTGEHAPAEFRLTGYIQEENKTGGLHNGRWFETEVHLDQSRFADLRRETVIEKPFKMGEKEYILEGFTQTPLRTDVKIREVDVKNRPTYYLLDPRLHIGRDNQFSEILHMYQDIDNSNGQHTIYFPGTWYREATPMRFTMRGMRFKIESDIKIKLDTERNHQVYTSDDRIKINIIREEKGKKWVSLKLEGSPPYSFGAFDWTDGNGRKYDFNMDFGARGTTDEESLIIILPDQKYKQPLTFSIYDYVGSMVYDGESMTLVP